MIELIMKPLLIVFLLCFSCGVFGQNSKQVDSLTFCFHKYQVPTGCAAESEYQLKCENYSMAWLYMNEQMLESMPDQFISQMAEQMKKFKKEAINCYLLDKEVKGYKISYKTDSGTGYQLIGYGNANGQPVLVQIVLDKEPKNNEDIPEFAREIIRLSK